MHQTSSIQFNKVLLALKDLEAEFFMTCTFGIGMLYSDISLFTYVQIVVCFLNVAFQFYTSKVI